MVKTMTTKKEELLTLMGERGGRATRLDGGCVMVIRSDASSQGKCKAITKHGESLPGGWGCEE